MDTWNNEMRHEMIEHNHRLWGGNIIAFLCHAMKYSHYFNKTSLMLRLTRLILYQNQSHFTRNHFHIQYINESRENVLFLTLLLIFSWHIPIGKTTRFFSNKDLSWKLKHRYKWKNGIDIVLGIQCPRINPFRRL